MKKAGPETACWPCSEATVPGLAAGEYLKDSISTRSDMVLLVGAVGGGTPFDKVA